MTSIADGSVCIQTSSEEVPATPSWFGEVVLLTAHLRKHGMLSKICEQVRGCRGDVLAATKRSIFWRCGSRSAISGERTDGGSSPSISSPLRSPSWPCLTGTSCPPVQRSPGF